MTTFDKARSAFLFVVLILFCSPADMAAGSFTLEQILSSPFPSDMASSPVGGKIAWVMNEEGVRNVWLAEAPEYRGRRITGWTEDDGQTISQLSWTPEGGSLVFVRGDGANRSGEFPNPLHLAKGTEQAIWMLPVGDQPRRLTEGTSPAVSPKGDGIAFLKDSQIWWLAFGKEEQKPEQLTRSRGTSGSLRWSPDGSSLAFVSNRGDHSFIGVYRVADKSLRLLDAGVDRDSNPAWSPDGRSIAYLRVPFERTIAFTPRRRALPFSIRVTDLDEGLSRQLWRADEGRGSAFRGIVAPNQLFWSSDGYIVFPWEKEGWTHLYSVPAAGGTPQLLTPGNSEVEQVSLSPDGTRLIYSSNQDDVDRRHLWRVPARGGSPQALTGGKSNEWNPTPLSDGTLIAFIGSTGRRPARPALLLPLGQIRWLASESLPEDFPEDELVEPQPIIFSSADGMRIHGQLFLPADHQPGQRHPAVLYFHGGSRRQMLLGWHYSSYYHRCYALNQYLANHGFIVLSVNYRSGIGYGMEFREALNYGAAGASEFNDVLGAGVYLRGRDDVDPYRIGLWGGSYGGYLTALGLARASDLFAAGVDLHGVHDWNVVIRNFVPSYDPQEREEAARLAFESSPMASLDTWRSPVLLIHGDDDRNVPFSETVTLAEALRKKGVPFELLVFPDEVHGFLTHRSWLRAFRAAAEFCVKHLGER